MHRLLKRRWLQFSLRTMFVLWTAVAVWLAWNVHVVRERRMLRDELSTRGLASFYRPADLRELKAHRLADLRELKAQERRLLASQLFSVDVQYKQSLGRRVYVPAYEGLPATDDGVSWMRSWMGDQEIATITLDAPIELPRVQRLFPEATIRVRKPNVPAPAPIRTLSASQPQERRLPLAAVTVRTVCWS
jgi:hypothetical protein